MINYLSLDTKKAFGADDIPTRFIQPDSIRGLETRLINHSIIYLWSIS